MKRIPSYIFRNMDIVVGGDDKIGQVAEFKTPDVKQKTEKIRNSGMIKERHVALGYEVGDCSFKMTAYDSATLGTFGIGIGADTELVMFGYYADEDGTDHSVVTIVRGKMTEIKGETHTPGKLSHYEYMFSVNYLNVEFDGAPVLEIDDFTLKIKGVDLLAGQNRALGRV